MTKLNLHHKEETVKEVKTKEMFRCPECHKDAEFSKWKAMPEESYSMCPNCKRAVKNTTVKKVKS